MAKLAITENPRIVRFGGPITKDVYRTHATQLWLKGTLLEITSGLLLPVVDTKAEAAEIDTDDTGTATRLFIALEDHTSAGTVFHAVQEILSDTVIEATLCATASTDPTGANVAISGSYTGYQLRNAAYEGTGLWGIDVDDTTKPVFRVIDAQSNYEPHTTTTTEDYVKVLVKVLPTIVA